MGIQLRKRKLADGRLSFYLDIYHNGKRSYRSLNLFLDKKKNSKNENAEIEALANRIRAKAEIEIGAEDNGFVPEHKKKANFVDFYYQMAIKRPNPGTRRNWINTYNYLKSFTNGYIEFRSVNEKFIEDFIDYLSENLSNNSVREYTSRITTALNQAVKERIILSNPCQWVKQKKKVQPKKEFLYTDELNKLAKAECKHMDVKLAFIFSCYSGLRFSDVSSLTFDDIDSEGIVSVKQQKTSNYVNNPLASQAQKIIEMKKKELGKETGKVFKLPNNPHSNVIIRDWLKKAEIKKRITFHCSRHTCAILLLEHDVDIYTVSKLLGHSSVKMTEYYAQCLDERKKKAVAKLPELTVEIA